MVNFERYTLANGLTVLTHEAWDTPLATVNLLYNVGARDEDPSRTGFAHLFEHLMFGGTERVPDYDGVLSSLGGESNAFTNNDFTNYHETLPVGGLATALALEADRMESLALNAKALKVQQQVVTEEYHQRYLGQPFDDMWLLMRPLCFKNHPYRWATIGADIRHVSEATLGDVQAFHDSYYRPDNAILSIAAPLKHREILAMVEEAWKTEGGAWEARCFARKREYPSEPEQKEPRRLEVERELPADGVYIAWPMGDRFHPDFRVCDLMSDLLGNGRSSRLYNNIVRPGGLVTDADAYITGDAGPGLIVVNAKVCDGVSPEAACDALREEVYRLTAEQVDGYELSKVINKYESNFVFSQYKAADRAHALGYYTWLGETGLVNDEPSRYREINPDRLHDAARKVFRPERENVLIMKKK